MDNVPKGTMKTRIDIITIADMNISSLIKRNLIENGFDLIVNPILDDHRCFLGERIEIFKSGL